MGNIARGESGYLFFLGVFILMYSCNDSNVSSASMPCVSIPIALQVATVRRICLAVVPWPPPPRPRSPC